VVKLFSKLVSVKKGYKMWMSLGSTIFVWNNFYCYESFIIIFIIYFHPTNHYNGAWGSVVVKALRY